MVDGEVSHTVGYRRTARIFPLEHCASLDRSFLALAIRPCSAPLRGTQNVNRGDSMWPSISRNLESSYTSRRRAMMLGWGHSRSLIRGAGTVLLVALSLCPCDGKIIPRRDPLDAALDSTVIVIMKQQSQGSFQVEEVFLGNVAKGQTLLLPGFSLAVEDTSALIIGVERIEPIRSSTRILVFLKNRRMGGGRFR
jgi:hypothetical protein